MGPTPNDPSRPADLDPGAFYALLAAFAAAHWGVPEEHLEVAPPSPERETELRLPDGTLVHVWQHAPSAVVSENAIRELAAFEERGPVALTTGRFSAGARALAAEEGIETIDGERFRGLLEEYGIEVPEPDATTLEDRVEELSSHFSESLSETAREVARTIDAAGEFEYDLSRADYSTDLEAIPVDGGEPVAKLRFSPAGLRLYVRSDGWQRVVGVSAHGEHVPPRLHERVREAIESL